MQTTKILITNFPRIYQRPSFVMVGDESKTMDIVCGYDIKVDNHQVTLNIARDLITALLTFDKIYIEGNHIWDILQVWGSEYVKEFLRLHILCVIPDQELNPVMMREGKGNPRISQSPASPLYKETLQILPKLRKFFVLLMIFAVFLTPRCKNTRLSQIISVNITVPVRCQKRKS
jgi:hypothetical protein